MRAQIAANILAQLGRFDVPIGIGRYTGDQNMPQYPIAQGYSLSRFVASGGNITVGTATMQAIMEAATPASPVYVIEIAPATSLGDVLAANPAAAASCVTVAMSGSIYVGYLNSSSPAAEYNVVRDIAASQRMYNASWLRPLVTAPLDTTDFVQFNGPTYAALLAANDSSHAHVSTLLANYVAWWQNGGKDFSALLPFSPSTGTDDLYDVQAAWMTGAYVAAAAATGGERAPPPPPAFPHIVTQGLPLRVTDSGYTVIDAVAGTLAYPATSFTTYAYNATAAIGADIIASIVAAM